MCPISSIEDLFKRLNMSGSRRDFRYLVLLVLNPKNLTPAGLNIKENFQYLDLRTEDIHFFMPGFSEINYNIENESEYYAKHIVAESKDWSSLMFDDAGFFGSIKWLEHYLDGFRYDEGAHLIVLNLDSPDVHGFFKLSFPAHRISREEFVHFNLDELHDNGTNIINVLSTLTRSLKEDRSLCDLRHLYIRSHHTLKEINIFIAGSKELIPQRNAVKSELLSIQNKIDSILRVKTFEDFNDYFIEGGRQPEYNAFIQDEADYVIFILDGKIGGITLDEFKVAMSAFEKTGHPKIFVYSRIDKKDEDKEIIDDKQMYIELIKSYCTTKGQYYTEYQHEEGLPFCVYKSFNEILRQ